MKHILFSTLALIGFSQYSLSQTAYSQALSCNTGSFSLGYVQQNAVADSLPNIGGFSMELTFLKQQRRFFSTSFGLETNFGARSYDKAIENIEFEGGYNGFASYNINRTDVGAKYIIGAQIGKIVEFSIPLRLGFRTTAYRQVFDLYEGQDIAEEDIVTEEEASEQNNDVFFRSNKFGFGTGLNLAFLPNSIVSPFVEIGLNYFGGDDLPMVDQAQLINGEINVPRLDLSNNNEMTFRVGVKINWGCPSNTMRVYRQPPSIGRDVAYRKHPQVETRIVRNTNSQGTNAQNNSNESERVILKPRKPRSPRTPADGVLF